MADVSGFKVVTLGEGAVGKTSLIMRYVYDVFSATQQTTIGSSFVERDVTVDTTDYKLRIWDTAGQERFDALTGFYARGARAVVVCFDLTDRESCAPAATLSARACPSSHTPPN
jgi:small GTP-binding protein